MSYVPIVVSPEPSPKARELAGRLKEVILDFEERYPSMTADEVREAARLAVRSSTRENVGPAFVTAALIGLLVLALVAYLVLGGSTVPLEGTTRGAVGTVVVGVLAATAIVIRKER